MRGIDAEMVSFSFSPKRETKKNTALRVLALCLLVPAVVAPREARAEDPAASSSVSSATPRVTISLKDALDRSLANSRDQRRARFELDAAEASHRSAVSQLLPTVKVTMNAGTTHNPAGFTDTQGTVADSQDINIYQGDVVLNQSLFAGFAHVAALKSTDHAVTSARASLAATENQVALDTIERYLRIQLVTRELSAEREMQKLRASQLEQVARRAREGRATELEKLQADYALKSQTPEIASLESEIEQKRLELVRLMGLGVATELVLTDTLEAPLDLSSTLPDFSKAYSVALERNPDVVKAQADLDKLTEDARIAAASDLPTLDFELTAGTHSNRRDEIGAQSSLTYGGQLKFAMTVFSGLSSFSSSMEREARVHALEESRSKSRETLLDSLQQLYREWKVADAKLTSERLNVELATETLKKAQALYAVGRATLTDILDGMAKKLTAEKQLATTTFDRIWARVRIKYLIGG